MLGRFTAFLLAKFDGWDARSKVGFFIAVLVLVPVLVIATTGPDNLRAPAALSTVAILMVMQGIFMWENRGMVTPFTQAQRAYMRGDFEVARATLETLREGGTRDVQALTLLGNTYRQLGRLAESERVLSECLNIHPNHYFPLYGFGRTLLAGGRYAEAIPAFRAALEQGAPPVTRFDLAEAYLRDGDTSTAYDLLKAARDDLRDEPHRALMADFWLYRAGMGDALRPDADGLLFWRTQAELFRDTPYGAAVAEDLAILWGLFEREEN